VSNKIRKYETGIPRGNVTTGYEILIDIKQGKLRKLEAYKDDNIKDGPKSKCVFALGNSNKPMVCTEGLTFF
jgi:hypothetical protein